MTSTPQSVIFASDPGIRATLTRMLEEWNCTIRPGQTEAEALQLIRSLPPRLVVGVWKEGRS